MRIVSSFLVPCINHCNTREEAVAVESFRDLRSALFLQDLMDDNGSVTKYLVLFTESETERLTHFKLGQVQMRFRNHILDAWHLHFAFHAGRPGSSNDILYLSIDRRLGRWQRYRSVKVIGRRVNAKCLAPLS